MRRASSSGRSKCCHHSLRLRQHEFFYDSSKNLSNTRNRCLCMRIGVEQRSWCSVSVGFCITRF
jgi:hypothetical protein